MCDNTLTIKLSKNLVLYGRSKHIRVRFHFIRDTKEQSIYYFVVFTLLICCQISKMDC